MTGRPFPRHNPLDPHNDPYPNDDTPQDDVETDVSHGIGEPDTGTRGPVGDTGG